MRFLLHHPARRSVDTSATMRAVKSIKESSVASKSACNARDETAKTVNNLTRSWGQQCSPSCGCVLRFETRTDERQRIVNCNYVAKSVVTRVDKECGGRLRPMFTTRMSRPMFQECKCQSLHALAKHVKSYLSNKRWDHVQGMNDFASTRSSIAFRHAVLSEHGLPQTDTHCFDIVEEAFSGMLNGNVPSKRRINTPFEKVLAAECLQRPLVVQYCRTKRIYIEDVLRNPQQQDQRNGNRKDSDHRPLGSDRNRVSMSTPKTMTTLGIFDIDAEMCWENYELKREDTMIATKGDQFDWLAYVDEQHMVDDSA